LFYLSIELYKYVFELILLLLITNSGNIYNKCIKSFIYLYLVPFYFNCNEKGCIVEILIIKVKKSLPFKALLINKKSIYLFINKFIFNYFFHIKYLVKSTKYKYLL
jgi:hypothetical protein